MKDSRTASVARFLRELVGLKNGFGQDAARRKFELLSALDRGRFSRAADVLALHEHLCFMRAYPDDAAVLQLVEQLLDTFDRRNDLRRFSGDLADTGIAGTSTHYAFFAPTARWLVRRWGDRLYIDWEDFDNVAQLDELIHHFALWAETPGLDESTDGAREWVERMRGPEETDAAFLVRSFAGLEAGEPLTDHLYDQLDPPLRLVAGPDTPSRTRAKYTESRVSFQTGPLRTDRPHLPAAIRRTPRSVRILPPRQAGRLVEIAREAMVTRSRDLDVFVFGDSRDVRLLDWGDGLVVAAFCASPGRRLLLESVYGMLTLKNGVPIGYGVISALFGSSEIAYNIFEAFRGGEGGHFYGAVLATAHRLFGSDTFTIYPYQLGDSNDDALQSGAWWFYQKLGFRPRNAATARLMRREKAAMAKRPRHRSTIPTLRRLARENLYYQLGKPRTDVIGELPLGRVGEAVTDTVAKRFGSDRRRARRVLTHEARALLGLHSLDGWDRNQRLMLQRWAPLVGVLPGVSRWSAAGRRALAGIVRAKGGHRESDYVRRFDRHRRVRDAVIALTQRAEA